MLCDDHISTRAEAELERILNSLGNGALRGEFKREWRVGDWALDFYFQDIRLAIEVDGGYHRARSRWRKDLQKTRELEARHITVLRLTNAEVLGDRERLVSRLRAAWRAALAGSRLHGATGFCVREPDAPAYFVAAAPMRRCRAAERRNIDPHGAARMALVAPVRTPLARKPHSPTVLAKCSA